MKFPRLFVISLLLAACLTSTAAAQSYTFSGNEQGVWLIRSDQVEQKFKVAHLEPGKSRWRLLTPDKALVGVPVASAPMGAGLHFLLDGDRLSHYYISPSPTGGDTGPATHPAAAEWPAGTVPLCVTAAPGFGDAAGPSMIAVVPRPAGGSAATQANPMTTRTRPATTTSATTAATGPTTTTGPASKRLLNTTKPAQLVHLGLFQYAANNWTYLGDLATVRMRSGYTAACSTTGNELFVRAAQTDGSDERMFRWSDGQVEPLQLPADVAGDRFVGMAAPEDRLVMVFAKPADNGRLDLHMALQDEDGGFDILPIVSGQEPVSFPSDQLPQVAAYGKEIALFWQPQEQADEETYPKIAVFDSNGEMLPASDIEVFAPSPFGGDGTAIRDAFLWIIVGLMVVLGFILRPRGAVKPFEFPQEDFQPAALWKRVVAVVIDLLPFLLLSSMLFMMQIPPDKLQQFQQRAYERAVQQDIPAALAWSVVGGMVSFGLYCAIMERKYGRTLGKMVFGLKVFGDKGQPLTWREALLRNIIKLFELNTWLFLPLWLLFCLMNPIRQRLGDVLARTAVGEKRDPNRPVIRHMTTGQVPGIPWMKPPQEQTPEQREEDEEPEETSGQEDSAEPNEENDSRDQDEAPRRE